MPDALSASMLGLHQLVTWPTPLYLLAGVAIGFCVGVLPGFGGPAALALMLPAVFPLSPLHGFVLLTAAAAVTTTAGDLTSIVLGVPGEATAAAIVPDGHALARRGEAGFATGAAMTASMLGALIGVAVLVVFIPMAEPLLAHVQSPELAALAVLGIALIVPLSRAHLVKGLIGGALGLSLATVGLDLSTGEPRFTFGQLTLWDGLGLLPVALGIYAIPEVLETVAAAWSRQETQRAATRGVADGCREAVRRLGLVSRCSLIGAAIGIVPGVGASVSQWTAYAHAAQSSRQREQFGSGAIEGVIGPAAATTATLGGALLPTLALGIPGSVGTAFLLGALIFKGITPGPGLLTPEHAGGHLTLVFSLVWCVALASVIAAVLGIATLGGIARVATIRPVRLFPVVLILVIIGTVGERHVLADLPVVIALGTVGYTLAVLQWPRAPLVLGFVLGPLLERRLLLSNSIYGWSWVLRPGVLTLAVAAAAGIAIATRARRQERERRRSALPVSPRGDLLVTASVIALAAAGLWYSLALPARAAFFPRLAFGIMLALSLWQLASLNPDAWRAVGERRTMRLHLKRLGWLLTFALNAWLFGLVVGSFASAALFLRAEARESWRMTLVMSAALALLTYILVVRLLHLSEHGGLIRTLF